MRLSRRRGQVTHVLLTRSPLIQNQKTDPFTVRLACVKHAASVRPEPGSNSPNKTNKTRPQPTTNSQPEPTVSTTVQKTRPGPTQPQTMEPGKPKQNKPQKPRITKIMRSPQGHGIKNMTHYRVLKQHTHRDLRPGRTPCLPLEGDRISISRLSFGNQIRIA